MGVEKDTEPTKISQHYPANRLPRNLAQRGFPTHGQRDAESDGGQRSSITSELDCGIAEKPGGKQNR